MPRFNNVHVSTFRLTPGNHVENRRDLSECGQHYPIRNRMNRVKVEAGRVGQWKPAVVSTHM